MQILKPEDDEFSTLSDAYKEAKPVGRYWRKGVPQEIRATSQFMMISAENFPEKIAIKAVRNLKEAERLARRLLDLEEKRGNKTEGEGEVE